MKEEGVAKRYQVLLSASRVEVAEREEGQEEGRNRLVDLEVDQLEERIHFVDWEVDQLEGCKHRCCRMAVALAVGQSFLVASCSRCS